MQRCPKLYQYSLFIEEIRQNQKQGSTLREAVGTAVDSCIRQGILRLKLKGKSDEEIADSLHLPLETIHQVLDNI